MWIKVSHAILKHRLLFLGLIFGMTLLMLYQGKNVPTSYDFTAAVPSDDVDLVYFNKFKKLFGDDGTVLAIGLKDREVYQLQNFKKFKRFTEEVSKLHGVQQVLSFPQMQYLSRDTLEKKFVARGIFERLPETQKELDSLVQFARNQQFYKGLLFNGENGATVALVAIEKSVLNSANRGGLLKKIQAIGDKFQEKTNIELHYGGLPFIRSIVTGQVASELKMLLLLSAVATAIILFLFFRSVIAVIFPLIIIAIVVIWCLGFMGLFGYKITILTGLLPPVLVVIGIPNCVYLLNKYHQEYRVYQNKVKALTCIIRKIGVVAFMTNTTTAIGFAVFIFMDNINLRQFGVISSLSIMTTFVISILLLPIFYSFLPAPTSQQLRHLDRKSLNKLLDFFHACVFRYRKLVYGVVACLVILAGIGIFQIKARSFMVDNIPADSKPKKDLAFFEENFNGVMPLEILINTKKKKGVMRLSTLKQVEKFENLLKDEKLISQPLSLVQLIKASKQAFYNNNPDFYALPSNQDKAFILRYLQGGQSSDSKELMNTLVDSTGQKMRVSLKVADVGSHKLDSLINKIIEPKIQQAFSNKNLEVKVTGTTLIFLKGNEYLIKSLQNSLLLAILFISILMAVLFGSVRMILISILSNLLPLAITAGLMGYFNIPLKPSTALIFSIAFGIAIDDSIHFLARYRQELFTNNFFVAKAITTGLRETGTGMIYTSIILFFGFIVFLFSDFDGTVALGLLTSITLLCAMFANLILLPALLISFDSGKYKQSTTQMIELYDETSTFEEDDEEINLDLIKVKSNS